MNIQINYTEAVIVRQALDTQIKDSYELLSDSEFQKKYPNCYKSVEADTEKAVALRDRIQAELDKI